MERLSTLKEKTKGKVVEIIGDTHFQSRIISIGITIGSDVEVIQNYKKQPILIYCRDTMIAVNKIEAEKIMMEVL
ncbi:FeoA domain protein [Aedoeadaptatus coxii]|uniref:FeoA domain-containing protein n=1 Tax=Aedoeadaptatus coxii TaxID=755172 RepID=UPI001762DA34|nr:FeoA domain-containing protein [Peptoniphilus coxii]CAC9930629.1 FeoA domain protein [Peptoniphilus coxii]